MLNSNSSWLETVLQVVTNNFSGPAVISSAVIWSIAENGCPSVRALLGNRSHGAEFTTSKVGALESSYGLENALKAKHF